MAPWIPLVVGCLAGGHPCEASIACFLNHSLGLATTQAIAIGIQDLPGGLAVSTASRREKLSRGRCFFYGQLSGLVGPIAGVIGAAAALLMRPILPYALSLAVGAMIYVVVEDLIPGSQQRGDPDTATIGAMGGFAVMTLLDVALGQSRVSVLSPGGRTRAAGDVRR